MITIKSPMKGIIIDARVWPIDACRLKMFVKILRFATWVGGFDRIVITLEKNAKPVDVVDEEGKNDDA